LKQKQPKSKIEVSSPEESSAYQNDSFQVGTRVLMIDLENCPSQLNELMEDVNQYSQVVVCYAQCGAKIPLDWLVPLTKTVSENRLRIVKMAKGGKNSADFGLSFLAGVLMAHLPLEAHFDIVSNDSDLDHVIDLLKSHGREAQRLGTKKITQVASIESSTTDKNATEQNYLQEYCSHLVKHSKSRPAKQETLLNNIKSKFKAEGIDPEKFLNELFKMKVISLKDKKINYNQLLIEQIADS
jgi:hypothetical protein